MEELSLDAAFDLAMEHHLKVGVALAIIFILSRFRRLLVRAALVAGLGLLFPLTETPQLWVWVYAGGVLLLAMLTTRRPSNEAVAYHEMYRQRVIAFYREHAPDKLRDVDAIMAKYKGNERVLWDKLQRKYATPTKPPPSYHHHQDDDREDEDDDPPRSTGGTPGNKATQSPAVQRARDDARRAMEARLNQRIRRRST